VHPPPSPTWANFSSWWNVRQKVAVATLCVLCVYYTQSLIGKLIASSCLLLQTETGYFINTYLFSIRFCELRHRTLICGKVIEQNIVFSVALSVLTTKYVHIKSTTVYAPRRNRDSPQPPTRRLVCPLPPVSGGRGTLAGEKGVGRVPIPMRGIHCGTLYMYVLCGSNNTTVHCKTGPTIVKCNQSDSVVV
jgi:hypothetical protein